MEQVVGQFRIFYVALNTPRTDDYHPVMVLCAKTDKAHRNVIHTSKLCFITLTPEISQRSHGKSSKRVFSCFPVFLLLKHRVICLLNHVKSFFLACLTQRCDSSVLLHKNRHTWRSSIP